MTARKPTKANKVFDVSKPGKTAASASSKPVIIGHKNMLKDPMVKNDSAGGLIMLTDPDDRPSGSPPPSPSQASDSPTAPELKNLTIKPLSEEAKTQPAKSTIKIIKEKPAADNDSDTKSIKQLADNYKQQITQSTQADEQSKEEKPIILPEDKDEDKAKDIAEPLADKPEDKTAHKDEEAETTDSSDQTDESATKSDDAAAINVAAEQTQQKKQPDKITQEQANRRAAMEKLIAEKKYFVPIGVKTRRKRSFRRTIIGILLILLMGALLVNLILDAKLLKTNVKAPIPIINR